ncbi:MAG: hypothetical protein Ta2A_03670 [Treponemataceae bacterium]|nr:MAG: hypothetical protein Ta2A_03670 [Treponemataceae bacterium]
MKQKRLHNILLTAILLLVSVAVFSCAVSVSDAAFTAKLAEIDTTLSAGDTRGAIKKLNSLQKKAKSANYVLGIYRRYMLVGEKKRAASCLKNGIKLHADNQMLLYVWAWFLWTESRFDEAQEAALKLTETAYLPLKLEIELRVMREFQDFSRIALVPLYKAAHQKTANEKWLMNTAILYAAKGDFKSAVALCPQFFRNSADALFWGTLFYDANYLTEALESFDAAIFLEPSENILLHCLLLKADCFRRLHDAENRDAATQAAFELALSLHDDASLPLLYHNIAYGYGEKKDYESQYAYLFGLVTKYPFYVPGLASYGVYSASQFEGGTRAGLEKELLETRVRSEQMLKYENIPRVPVEDALSRMERALNASPEKSKDSGDAKDMSLYIDYLELSRFSEAQKNGGAINDIKNGWLWRSLEENVSPKGLYPEALIRYALLFLMNHGESETAQELFATYFQTRFGDTAYAAHKEESPAWLLEICAWYLGKNGQLQDAADIYEYLNEHSYTSSTEAVLNLAEICIAKSDWRTAIALYAAQAGIETSPKKKAEILFRLAKTQSQHDEKASAIKNLEYCISLNAMHQSARILLQTLQE